MHHVVEYNRELYFRFVIWLTCFIETIPLTSACNLRKFSSEYIFKYTRNNVSCGYLFFSVLDPIKVLSSIFDFATVCVMKYSCAALVKPNFWVLDSQILESIIKRQTIVIRELQVDRKVIGVDKPVRATDQRWNNVYLTLKMKQNLTLDFRRCTISIQRQCPTSKQHQNNVAQRRNNLEQRWYNVILTLFQPTSILAKAILNPSDGYGFVNRWIVFILLNEKISFTNFNN